MPDGVSSPSSSSPTAASPPAPGEVARAASTELSVIRGIIVGPEQVRVTKVEQRLDNPMVRAREMAEVLPAAVAMRVAKDGQLAMALAPAIESSIKRSVERNPQPLVDAIFPIIGPAIRKSIGESLQRMLQELSGAMEQRFSARALRWRWESFKTGKPYAEVVLLHTLRYRVEQAFLIHRETGLLLLHLTMPGIAGQDPHSVSAMLTALQDFVRDSFDAKKSEGLEKLKVGGREVWLEAGPRAVLALAIARVPSETLRPRMQEAIEQVHLQLGQQLSDFTGDAAPFGRAAPIIEPLLGDVKQDDEVKGQRRPISVMVWVVLVVLLGVIGWFWFASWLAERRWSRALEALRNVPGIVIAESGRKGGKWFVSGLRDPLAADPMRVLEDADVKPEDVDLRLKSFQSLDEAFVGLRVQAFLQPPKGVELSMAGGTLKARGAAAHRWIVSARRGAAQLPGVTRFDGQALRDIDLERLEALRAQAEANPVRFVFASTELAKNQDDVLNAAAAKLLEIYQVAAPAGIAVSIQVIGNTDGSGTEERNVRLSRDRADRVVTLLVGRGVPAQDLMAVGVGSAQPLAQETSETAKERNRYATLRIAFAEAPLSVHGADAGGTDAGESGR